MNQEGIDDEEEDLINQIELEMRKIHLSVEKLYNNLSVPEPDDDTEKCLIQNYCYCFNALQNGVNDNSSRIENTLETLEESFQKELDFLSNEVERVLKKMNDHKELLDWMNSNTADLQAIINAPIPQISKKENMKKVKKNIILRFRREKEDLKKIINVLFPENYDVQDLLASVIEHHFSEGEDKYLQLENSDDILERVEALRRTSLIEVNPHNPLQIRLVELV